MNAKDILKKLKAEFAKMQLAFAEAKLADGTMIKYEGDLAVGTAIMVTADGTDAPIADGEYTLEDGSIMVVASGLVTEMKPVEMGEDFATQMKPYEDRIAATEGALAQLVDIATKSNEAFEASQKELADTKAENEKFKAEFKAQATVNATILSGLEKIAKAPVVSPTDPKKKEFAAEKSIIEEEIENMAAVLKSRKN
jgi:hypothetical protein